MNDTELMRHALSLSLKYKYTAKPNPTVGALIYDGKKSLLRELMKNMAQNMQKLIV